MIRKFLARLFLTLFPVTLLVMAVNYKVDPANIFSTNLYVRGIAEILSAGHNTDNISNYDERLLQEQMITRLSTPPEMVVLGSSRVMQVGMDFFPGRKILNCGVSHANIKDIIAIVGLLDTMKMMPAKIILNVDPGLICKDGTSEWESLGVYYNHFLGKLSTAGGNPSSGWYMFKKKCVSLFSLQYFQSSVSFLGKGRTKEYRDVGHQLPALYGRLSDGTVSYAYDYSHPDSVLMANSAATTAEKNGIGDFDAAQQQLLELLLNYLTAKKIVLQLYMLPYHPAYYAAVNKFHHQQFTIYEAYYRELARKKGIPLTGSFNPAAYNISAAAFYDDSHSSKESLKKILIPE